MGDLPSVCVIGAGVSGLTACKALSDFGVPHTCFEASDEVGGNWYFQNPLFYGYAAVNGYLPSEKIAIAVAVTYQPEAFNNEGQYSNGGDALFRRIGDYLAPNDAPPTKSGS